MNKSPMVQGRVELLHQDKKRTQTKHGLHKKEKQPFPDIRFVCEKECYGKFEVPFYAKCSQCLGQFTASVKKQNQPTPHLAIVVGAGVHIMSVHKSNMLNSTIEEIRQFLARAPRVIFASMPNFDRNHIPLKYRNATHHVGGGDVHDEMLPLFFPNNPQQPFLDYFELTKACTMSNCSYDGGHRSRYVNRWKAQLLLNTICEVSKNTTSTNTKTTNTSSSATAGTSYHSGPIN